MDTTALAIATITWARTPDEEERLRRSLQHLADKGMPVAIADAGTSRRFADFLAGLAGAHVTATPARGLVGQVKASLELAASFDRPFVLYTEPDKEGFLAYGMRDFVRRAIGPHGPTGLGAALASRSEESFRTYPPMQRYTESVINQLCGDLLGCPGDFSYGPFVMTRALVPHLRRLDGDVGWGWRHFAFRTAHRLGWRVVHVTDDYPCPPDQRIEDDAERTHRLRQLSENILGLIAQPSS